MTPPRHFLLTGAHRLVTMNPGENILADGWVAATDGMITAVGEGSPPEVIAGTQIGRAHV